MNEEQYDAPLDQPIDDLLGVAASAKVLAERLRDTQGPFTAGIYGEWGSGKTSFVKFVAHYLAKLIGNRPDGSPNVVFIDFSAWQYKNADELWRALILEIGRQLLGVQNVPSAPPSGQSNGWTLKQFLASDAVVVREKPSLPEAQTRYASLIASLDSALYGGISKSSTAAFRLNSSEAGVAVAKGVVAALAGAYPLIGGLRRLIGLNTEIDATKLFDREQNQSTRRRIESMDAFQVTLKRLFDETLNGRRVFVFVDDLDRCMPDAALDLLDAITVFIVTQKIPCGFIVAADETLIGQGLKMRLREVVEAESNGDAETFFETKGRQYFEKVIQLPVPLPRPGSADIQRFIAGGFPECMPASDLIEAAIGTNPRRVKQYCSRLQYRRKVLMPHSRATLFDELVTLRSKDEKVFDAVRQLARTPSFHPVIRELEAWARDPTRNPTLGEAQALQDRIGSSRAVRRILAEPPEMSRAEPKSVLMLSEFADLRPDSERMFYTQDPLFMRVLDKSKRGLVKVKKLILDDFAKLAAIRHSFPELAEKMTEVAREGQWVATMTAVEGALRPKGTTPSIPEAKAIVDLARTASASPGETPLASLIDSLPLLSAMPAEEVRVFDRIAPRLPHPDTLIDREITPNPSLAEKGRALAKRALEILQQDFPTEKKSIWRTFTVRRKAVKDVVALRTFVKKDLLEHCSPELYDLMRRDYAGLVQVEKEFLSPDQANAVRLGPYLKNKQLVRLMKLQPYFGDLPEFVASQPLADAVAPAVVEASAAAVSPVLRPPAASAAPIELPQVQYQDVYLTLKASPGSSGVCEIEMKGPDGVASVHPLKEAIDWGRIRNRLHGLSYVRRPNVDITRDVAVAEDDILARLKSLGLLVYDLVFQGPVRHSLLALIASARGVRLHWQIEGADPDAAVLPWECLYVPTAPVGFLALSRHYSLTRHYPVARSMIAPPISGTLRILFVAADPPKVAPLPMIDQEIATLRETAQAAGNRVDTRVIRKAAPEEVRRVLAEFRPHIFHFSGHGLYREGVGHLVFEEASGEVNPLPAEQIAILLHQYDVHLAVLNGCDTGVSSANDAVSSVAGAVVRAGVPAVIATMREVQDEQAMLFTRDFYRAFFAGFTVEGAMAEARKALSLDYWDWAAYALFVGSADLSAMRVLTAMRSEPVVTA